MTTSDKVKKDKSPQGFYDQDIIPLLNVINSKEGYETTSSCSGRITIMEGTKKGFSKWIYKTHDLADYKEVFKVVRKLEDNEQLRFLYESLIVHLNCSSLEKAEKMLKVLHKHGFKKSSFISFKNNIIEISDTGNSKMETILTNELSEEYVQKLVNEANRRLTKTKQSIAKMEKVFQEEL